MNDETDQTCTFERTDDERSKALIAMLARNNTPKHKRQVSALQDLDELIEKAERRREEEIEEDVVSDSNSEIEFPDEVKNLQEMRKKMRGDFLAGTEPAQTTAKPAPGVTASDDPDKRRTKKPSIEAVALDYMRDVYKAGQYSSAPMFHKHLKKATEKSGSLFEMGTGINAGKLFCPAAGSFFDVGTLGKMWAKVRAK